MKKVFLISGFLMVFFISSGQIDDRSFHKRPVQERAKQTYSSICKYNHFEEEAFMYSQLHPSMRTIFLKRLPDVVSDEVKKLKDGEFTKPIYVNESCYIVKRIKKKFFKYILNIIYFENHSKPIYDLPKN